ncbi:MAG: PilN domain-containing protein [Candidatus Omnitrophota bacterium]
MFTGSRDYVSITVADGILKAVHVRGSMNDLRVMNIVRRDIKDVPDEELGKLLLSVMDALEIKKASALYVLPANIATTKNIEIPSIDPQEIKSIIDLQAGRHTPFSREEILVGSINIGIHSRNYTKVLLIIVNRQIVKKYLNIFEQAGLKIDKVVFAPEAKARFYGKVLNLKEDDAPIGVIDVGKRSTDFIVEAGRTVIASRNIPLGLENLLKDGPEAMKKLVDELAQSIETYRNEDINKVPETYLLTSDDSKIKELQVMLHEKLKANIKILPCLDHVVAMQSVLLKIVSEYDDESFLDIIAPLSVMDGMQVDLTPDEVKIQRSIEEQGHQVIKSGAFAIILLLLICAIFFTKIYFRGLYLNKLSSEFEVKRKLVEDLEQIATNTRIVKDYLGSRMVSLDVIKELYDKMPNEMYLKSVTLEDDGSISLDGVSETRSTAFAFITILEDSKLFKNAKMVSSSAKKERGKDVSAFQISFQLESAVNKEEPEIAEGVVLPAAAAAGNAEEAGE